MTVLRSQELSKTYRGGDGGLIAVLDRVDVEVDRGEMVAIVGASGTGKSTLLHLFGALDRPTAGEVFIDDHALSTLADEPLSSLRNRKIGFVFQFHHLLREFSALENVEMPLRLAGWSAARRTGRARDLLARVGLEGRMHHRPGALSGGEQQRAAVARALAAEPSLLLADEPSGNLDHASAERLHELLAVLAQEQALAVVVVTHNRSLAGRADRVLTLENGKLTGTAAQDTVT